MNRRASLGLFALTSTMLLSVGCDYSGDFLFDGAIEGVRGIDHLGTLEPANIESAADVEGAVIIGEIGPTGTAAKGGVTFTFEGTGDSVCIFVDPEAVFWNQSVAVRNPNTRYQYPDNPFDDGDLDLYAGFATYYTGTPATQENGGEIGDFFVRYEDSLDEEIQVALNECVITSMLQDSGGHAGRGSPEYCTIRNTQPGVSYVGLLETFSVPIDDRRLGYGLLLANGTCSSLLSNGQPSFGNDECLIRGEAVRPRDSEEDPLQPWPAAIEFEEAYCSGADMADYCEGEANRAASGAIDCEEDHCFCGDPDDTPTGGAF